MISRLCYAVSPLNIIWTLHKKCYRMDPQTMKVKALFSLYLYFFHLLFTATSQGSGQDLFPAFLPRYFQSGAVILHNCKFLRVFYQPRLVRFLQSLDICYQWNYNGGLWQKYHYFFFYSKTRNKWNATYLFRQYSCFPIMGAINSLRARDQQINCQSQC